MKTVNPQPGPRYQATLQLLRAADAIWQASQKFFQKWDLSPSQFNVLNLLRDYPDGLSQTTLSRELIMHRSNVTGLADRLEKRGLIERRDTPGDRRAYQVALTPAGQKLLAEILPGYYQGAEAVWDGLSAADIRQTTQVLERISAHAQKIPSELQQ
jgi:MarR family 2-MHQ and catechol resistance regulon transcriptional repressor